MHPSKNIFLSPTIAELKERIQKLSPNARHQWGKMTPDQMIQHCMLGDQVLLQQTHFPRLLMGRIFGPLALRANLNPHKTIKKNIPTHPKMVVKNRGDVQSLKEKWLKLLDEYPKQVPEDYHNFIHPFFGKMTYEEVSLLGWKHIDHHLRQFSV